MKHIRIIRNMGSLDNDLDNLVDNMVYGTHGRICSLGQAWTPQIDIYETEASYIIWAELPGLNAEDMEIIVDRLHVSLSGCRLQPEPPDYIRVHQSEVSFGRFKRLFKLPNAVEPEEVEASLHNGMLKITMQKAPSGEKRVEIK